MRTSPRERLRAWLLAAASRGEQEIRSYPRVYVAFYRLLTADPRVRALAGKAKAGVRDAADSTVRLVRPADLPEVEETRRAALRERLELS